jgi:hypothetical protein
MMETEGRDLPYSPITQVKDLVHKSAVHRNGRVAVYTQAEKDERNMSNTGMMKHWNFKMHINSPAHQTFDPKYFDFWN